MENSHVCPPVEKNDFKCIGRNPVEGKRVVWEVKNQEGQEGRTQSGPQQASHRKWMKLKISIK